MTFLLCIRFMQEMQITYYTMYCLECLLALWTLVAIVQIHRETKCHTECVSKLCSLWSMLHFSYYWFCKADWNLIHSSLIMAIPHPLYCQQKNPYYTLNRSLLGLQIMSGHCEKQKSLLPVPGIYTQFLSCLAHSLVAILMLVSWLTNMKCIVEK